MIIIIPQRLTIRRACVADMAVLARVAVVRAGAPPAVAFSVAGAELSVFRRP